jgi:hypothetical protein
VRKLKIFFLAVTVIGFAALSGGCKKTYTTVVQSKDSVFSSGWQEITTTYVSSDSAYEATITNSAITQSIVSDGVVLAYLGYVSSANDTVGELAGEDGVYTLFTVGSLQVISPYGDLTYSNSGFFFRYVIVPGSVLATNNLTKQEAKSLSYTEITKLASGSRISSAPSITQ